MAMQNMSSAIRIRRLFSGFDLKYFLLLLFFDDFFREPSESAEYNEVNG